MNQVAGVKDAVSRKIAYKVARSQESHWADTKVQAKAVLEELQADSGGSEWKLGTVFADGFVNFDANPKTSGFTQASPFAAFRYMADSRQWDGDLSVERYLDQWVEPHVAGTI
ncbi:hypothetical protein [Candidatus Phyllobacterium onerii]|uniref:hypothetical protein n=1 Tax=Candidatus Phyllobacterium onerii TaxID=3020828 RepID=UPI00232C5F50|nr:hypothetical protein [Phyllobacterium sp. IY22]